MSAQTVSDELLSRVHLMRPGVELSSARLATNGAQYDVVIASDPDDAWVFRFAKNDASRAAMQRELALLDAIAGRTPVPVPVPELRAVDAMAYRLLPGEPLTHWLLQSLEPSVQQRLAEQLGEFLQMLHGWPGELPLPVNTNAGGSLDDLHEHFRRTLYAYLDAHQQVWIDRLFADAASITANQPAPRNRLIHNDFKVGHVLYDARTQRLSGILDFGIACYDAPDIDVCNLLQCFGESFVTRMCAAYPEIQAMLPGARFGVHLMELEAVADGILTQDPHRMVANLAVPRDVRFPIV